MIRNIIFDFGAVILDLNPDRCKQAFREIGFVQIDEVLSTAHQRGVLDEVEKGTVSIEDFCEAIRRDCQSEPLPSNRQIVAAFTAMADGIPTERLDFVAQLKKEGYHVDALSNTNAIHWGYCQRYFIECGYVPEQLFDHMWLSYQMRLVKPDPAIFAEVLKESGYQPGETLFVDDNAENCRVAESMGIRTLCPLPRTDWRAALRELL